ncbi:CYTH domain-containing protein [Neobacillus sp. K501]
MSEMIEIEFKNMLTISEYERFLQIFKIAPEQIFTQENHYFDTADFTLKKFKSALRIRQKADDYELTLKQPANVGLLETTQILTLDEYITALQNGPLPKGIVSNRITELGIPIDQVEYFGSLTTNRVEFLYKNGLLVLDHSFYLNKDDYELEYEVENYQLGKQIFLELLKQYDIPIRPTKNKIRRFYEQKYLNDASK